MKKIYFSLMIVLVLTAALPALAATAPAKKVWQPIAPKGYAPITWASAPGIASFYRAAADNGALDFVTRIYLPQNQINFILSTSSPKILNSASTSTAITANTFGGDMTNFSNLSFKRLAAETAKIIDPAIKFLWDVSFLTVARP